MSILQKKNTQIFGQPDISLPTSLHVHCLLTGLPASFLYPHGPLPATQLPAIPFRCEAGPVTSSLKTLYWLLASPRIKAQMLARSRRP